VGVGAAGGRAVRRLWQILARIPSHNLGPCF
jgi:hypothetical protein